MDSLDEIEQQTASAVREIVEVSHIKKGQIFVIGAFGTACWQHFDDPVMVENLNARAAAGLDIGQTLIGMHIHPVVVPVRISLSHIGDAVITCARRRPKYVGGQRAIYDRDLM